MAGVRYGNRHGRVPRRGRNNPALPRRRARQLCREAQISGCRASHPARRRRGAQPFAFSIIAFTSSSASPTRRFSTPSVSPDIFWIMSCSSRMFCIAFS